MIRVEVDKSLYNNNLIIYNKAKYIFGNSTTKNPKKAAVINKDLNNCV